MWALCLAAAAFLPSPTTPLLAPAARRAATASVRMDIPSEERSESAKAGGVAAFSGSIASAPVKASALLSSKAFTWTQWEFSTGALAAELFFFGILYRLCIRMDDNDQLKQTCVGAFALFRAFSATQVTNKVTPDTWLQLCAYFGESILAFGGAAFALEYVWNRGKAFPCPPELPPSYRDDYGDRFRDYDRDYPPRY